MAPFGEREPSFSSRQVGYVRSASTADWAASVTLHADPGSAVRREREASPEHSFDQAMDLLQRQDSAEQQGPTYDSIGLSDCSADSASSAQSVWNPNSGALLCDEGLDDDQAGRQSLQSVSVTGRNLAAALSRQDSTTSEQCFPREGTPAAEAVSYTSVTACLPDLQHSLIGHLASIYRFSSAAVSLGTTYMQRLAREDYMLLGVARASQDFAPLVAHIFPEAMPTHLCTANPSFTARSAQLWLISVHLCCINLAAKLIESVPFHNLLQTMLSHVHGRPISTAVAEELEMKCLKTLDWRLGPFYTHTF